MTRVLLRFFRTKNSLLFLHCLSASIFYKGMLNLQSISEALAGGGPFGITKYLPGPFSGFGPISDSSGACNVAAMSVQVAVGSKPRAVVNPSRHFPLSQPSVTARAFTPSLISSSYTVWLHFPFFLYREAKTVTFSSDPPRNQYGCSPGGRTNNLFSRLRDSRPSFQVIFIAMECTVLGSVQPLPLGLFPYFSLGNLLYHLITRQSAANLF